nr:unnamed protein product [Spirometra erinaceieuropaei]
MFMPDSLPVLLQATRFFLSPQAIKKFDMIQPNDKILVCLSGGKDSLSLLHCMHEYQQVCNRRPDLPSFELGAVTVDPGSSAYNPRPLIAYMAELRVPYLYEEQSQYPKLYVAVI